MVENTPLWSKCNSTKNILTQLKTKLNDSKKKKEEEGKKKG